MQNLVALLMNSLARSRCVACLLLSYTLSVVNGVIQALGNAKGIY